MVRTRRSKYLDRLLSEGRTVSTATEAETTSASDTAHSWTPLSDYSALGSS